ncbi:polyamine-modulated factor 1-binding protein 1-like [Pristis pectinata]|uniref:polyamine-modulated factor 1-binding protein 1-like n=1 Tax=Pristis pectinata TaxID=685728 RepID=UPI00223E85B8|nr:polyamine-modulated factor 1-binding protein 1-like [Pristis pectinata]
MCSKLASFSDCASLPPAEGLTGAIRVEDLDQPQRKERRHFPVSGARLQEVGGGCCVLTREQAKKAASIPPRIAQEAEKMLKEMKELQAEIEFIQLEIRKRDARIATSKSEKELFYRNLCSAQESSSREKRLLMEEMVQMKKVKEIANQDIAYKESELVKIKQELERTTAAAKDGIRQVWLLETQLNQHVEKHQAAEVQLGEKKLELLKAQVALHQCEEKYYTSTVSMQDHVATELRNEISSLQQKLREQEVLAEEDKFLRSKEADDCSRLTKENAVLHSQVVELTQDLERAQAAIDEKNSQHSNSITQLTSLKENERWLELELAFLKRVIEEEEKKVVNAMEQLQHLEQGKSSVELNRQSLQNQLATLEKQHSSIKLENSHLKREKNNLVEHISELHKQISEKDVEILRMKGYIHTLAQDLGSLKSQLKMESSLRSESCKEISSIADTMKQVANTMNRRNNENTTVLS